MCYSKTKQYRATSYNMCKIYFLIQLMSLVFSCSFGKIRNEDLNSPECGKVSSTGTPLVINGTSAERSEVPWHAGIYTKNKPYQQICGGSLISHNVILSAAHCFWNQIELRPMPAANFAVAVGKLYRPWSDPMDDPHAQRSNVTALHLQTLFRGSLANYQGDIAVVVAMMKFQFTTFVRPVCVDFDHIFQDKQLKAGNMGKVAGWGLTSVNGPLSQILKVIDLPVVIIETCLNESPPDFLEYITADKICAGFKNENKGICRGDSGGGLVFLNDDESGTPRFYLRGIASTAPSSDVQCNLNFYTTFTNIQGHEHFIKQLLENGELPCKEESLSSDHSRTPDYSMDNETLNYATVKRDSAGRLTYFELHVAIQADYCLDIWMRDKYHTDISVINIGCDSNDYTILWYQRIRVQHVHTPDILSSTQFRTFYFRVDDGKFEFGKQGDSSPLVSHYDAGYSSLNYFWFYHKGNNTSKIRFDCPRVTELPCKEESFSSDHPRTSDYSMDNVTLKHATVQRDSAGRLTYFEMHVAIQADFCVDIWMRDKYHSDISVINVGCLSNQYTVLWYQRIRVQHVHTPDLLSSTQFRNFYIRVDDGKLEFRKEGDSSPLVSHYDAGYSSLNYFWFYHTVHNTSKIRFDCPRVTDLPCKEESLSTDHPRTPDYSMDKETLNFTTVQRESAGRLTYFEMHVAIQADYCVDIWMRDKYHTDVSVINIGCDSNDYTILWYQGTRVQHVHTPDILSSTQFRTFYFKIDNGKFEFGKEGDSSPLVSHYDAGYSSLKYFWFYHKGNNTTKIHYDCPHVTELPCKEESFSSDHPRTPDYSMDNVTLKHATVKRDSAGRLTYFELHVSIQAAYCVDIWMRDKYHSDVSVINIGCLSNQYTVLWFQKTRVQHVHTPDLLSSTQFRTFYIRVDDGKFEFGKEGDSSPLVSHYDAGYSSLKYFWFYHKVDNTSKIRFDCPHVTESS